ncbi:hypothetical protein SO802_021100 [Lithocarpus litseifolius]|uniref:Uncharacterized protein n=1 Tax=Lithocarpus litseifolius TaxID=425828 RepID=A0AAW2CDY1_9ROSI
MHRRTGNVFVWVCFFLSLKLKDVASSPFLVLAKIAEQRNPDPEQSHIESDDAEKRNPDPEQSHIESDDAEPENVWINLTWLQILKPPAQLLRRASSRSQPEPPSCSNRFRLLHGLHRSPDPRVVDLDLIQNINTDLGVQTDDRYEQQTHAREKDHDHRDRYQADESFKVRERAAYDDEGLIERPERVEEEPGSEEGKEDYEGERVGEE